MNLVKEIWTMINAKVKILGDETASGLQSKVNEFLSGIDVRQIIKTEYSSSVSTSNYNTHRSYSVIIFYVDFEDIRDAKIDNVLEIK
jgi:hypothetical protein